MRMNGVFLNEGEQVDQVDPETGARQLDLLEDERAFDATEVERKITAPDSNRKILEELKRYADEHEREYGRFPKTLIFAANDLPHTSHADQLVDMARDVFGRGEAFVAKITGRVDRPLQRIREFRNRPNPGIVVTVDLLTTGVDIPDLEFIVFLRPVKSRILFEQMLGRGTRTGRAAPGQDHTSWSSTASTARCSSTSASTTGMTVEPPEGDGKTIAQIIEEIWQNRDRDYNTRRLVKRLQRIDKEMSGEARDLFARFIPDGDMGRFAEDLPALLRDDRSPTTMKILRDTDFQTLLDRLPARPSAPSSSRQASPTTVESEWLIRGGAGKEYKPERLPRSSSSGSSRSNADRDRRASASCCPGPQDWGADAAARAARSAQRRHRSTSPRPTSQRAFQRRATTRRWSTSSRWSSTPPAETSPLLTAEERVDAAVARVTAGRAAHRRAGEVDGAHPPAPGRRTSRSTATTSTTFPCSSDRGGWGRANRAFDGQLAELLDRTE